LFPLIGVLVGAFFMPPFLVLGTGFSLSAIRPHLSDSSASHGERRHLRIPGRRKPGQHDVQVGSAARGLPGLALWYAFHQPGFGQTPCCARHTTVRTGRRTD
jgi:hypothetical protein